jgi:hypothetical protein
MKTLRMLLALAVAGAFTLTVAHAGDDKAKSAEKTCSCVGEGKTCATEDKACCCTGEKAKPADAKDKDMKKKEKKEKKAKKDGKEEKQS